MKIEVSTEPKYKVGDVVIMDSGWDRQVAVGTVSTVVRSHCGYGYAAQYWGTDAQGHEHGFYESQVESPPPTQGEGLAV